jgi:hypothetical protein
MILTTFGHNPDRLPLKRIFEGGVDTLTVAGTLGPLDAKLAAIRVYRYRSHVAGYQNWDLYQVYLRYHRFLSV